MDKGWSVMDNVILYGAGTVGRTVAKKLIASGNPPRCFADNNKAKWGTEIEGIPVVSPESALGLHPEAKWLPTIFRASDRGEVASDLSRLGVSVIEFSIYDYLSPHHTNLPLEQNDKKIRELLSHDKESMETYLDQLAFRRNPNYHVQRTPRDVSKVYFEDFFTRRNDEHFVDCGAADGDTAREFMRQWKEWHLITAFEPDPSNYRGLRKLENGKIDMHWSAISDHVGIEAFVATSDQSSHLGNGNVLVPVSKLDGLLRIPPTFIKMDIEGSEREALWGARESIRINSPVLAICAYHKGDDLWTIPLLIDSIQPNYRLFFRQYMEKSWELIWYAVPSERVI